MLIINSVYENHIDPESGFNSLEEALYGSLKIAKNSQSNSYDLYTSLNNHGVKAYVLLTNKQLYHSRSDFYRYIEDFLSSQCRPCIFNQHVNSIPPEVISGLRKKYSNSLFAFFYCSPVQDLAQYAEIYDLIFNCSPQFSLEAYVEKSISFPHFSPQALLNFTKPKVMNSTIARCSFFGSTLPKVHQRRIKLLKYLANKDAPIDFFTNYRESTLFWVALKRLDSKYPALSMHRLVKCAAVCFAPFRSKLYQRTRSPLFNDKLFLSMQSYICTLNVHADVAGAYAANVRLFEAAALGTCMITESFGNLSEFFEPDHEVLTYSSFEECYEKIMFCILNPEIALRIGRRARQRALKCHGSDQRITTLIDNMS